MLGKIPQPRVKVYQKIEFEALGQRHIVYAPNDTHEDVIIHILSMLTNTAHLVAISTDLINEETYKQHSLDNIINHYNNVLSYEINHTEQDENPQGSLKEKTT